jgi:hypothetical protein
VKKQIKCKILKFFIKFFILLNREFPICDISIPNGYSMFNFKNERKLIYEFAKKKENNNISKY